MASQGTKAEIAPDLDAAVPLADVISCATLSIDPIVKVSFATRLPS